MFNLPFQHRASCGFVKVAPANVSEVLKRKQTKPQVALILVELCCQEDSGLKSVNTAFGYIGVTEKCEDMKTYKDVRARIDVLRNAARASGLDCHLSCAFSRVVSMYCRFAREILEVSRGR